MDAYRSRAATATIAAVVALAGGVAAAAESPAPPPPAPAALVVEGCSGPMAAAVRGHLALELGDQLIGDGSAARGDRVSIACDDDIVWISVRGPEGGEEVDRTVVLANFPADAGPRAIALAAIEALSALTRRRAEARSAPTEAGRHAPVPAAAAVGGPPAPSVPTAHPATVVVLSGAWRTFLVDQGLSLWGASLDLDREVGRRFDLGLDLEVAGGARSQLGLGDATVVAASARGSFGLRGRWRTFHGVVSLGARLGVARLVGRPPTGSATIAGDELMRPWGGPVLSTSAFGAHGRFGLRIAAELGYSAIGAEGLADGVVVVAMRGPWVNVTLGVGFLP